MSRSTWNKIKRSKLFYIDTYRRVLKLLIISGMINTGLAVLFVYLMLHRPEPVFYASNGITPPIELQAQTEPNYSTQALLPPDPVNVPTTKIIPE